MDRGYDVCIDVVNLYGCWHSILVRMCQFDLIMREKDIRKRIHTPP